MGLGDLGQVEVRFGRVSPWRDEQPNKKERGLLSQWTMEAWDEQYISEYRGKGGQKGIILSIGTVGPPIICTDQKVNVQFVANYPTTNNLSHFFLIWPIDDDANSMLVGGFTLSILSKLNDNNSVCRWREIKRPPPSLKIYFCIYVAKHIYLGGGGAGISIFSNTACPGYFWWFFKFSNTWRDKSLCLYFAFKSAVLRPALVTSIQLFVIQLCFDSPFHFIYWVYGEKCDF